MLKKLLSIGIFFLGIGLWIIIFVSILFWITPALLLMYFAGWLSHARAWPELKNYVIWKWMRQEYFRFKLEGAENLVAEQNGPVIYAIYPHGHFSVTHVFYWALNPAFSESRAAIHSFIFWIPIFSTFAKWIEAIHVTESDMKHTLSVAKKSIYMCPGGIADIANTGTVIKKRSGFIRLARECKAKVIPVWCPQERSYYSHWLPFGRCFGGELPVMLIWGVWWCPFLPRRVPEGKHSRIIIGTPIDATDAEADEKFWAEMHRIQSL